jgi:hypothetical protein
MKKNIFTYLLCFLVIILPFYVLLVVIWRNIFGIDYIWIYIKEFVIIWLFFSLIYEYVKLKKIPKFEIIDYLIFSYILYWVWISLFNWLGFNSIIYWWRYDFLFLIVFLIIKHSKQFIQINLKTLIKYFLLSSALSLFFSILIKFRIWEDSLLIFGYTQYVSDWTFSWWIPNYHWLENSGIKRFQWIFDWPNQMAFFIILFTSLFLYKKKLSEFHIILFYLIMLGLLFITYSRSALLWVFTWFFILMTLNLKNYYKKYKKYLIKLLSWFIIILWFIMVIFNDNINNIFLRTSSTTWHFDRMQIWLDRFISKPLWAWLAEAWPAYRSIYKDKQTKKDEQYYIPESWFIQQLIEWWVIFFVLFLSIIINILHRLYYNNKILFIWFISILVMNIFLHIFEATYLSILLFIFLWLFYSTKK